MRGVADLPILLSTESSYIFYDLIFSRKVQVVNEIIGLVDSRAAAAAHVHVVVLRRTYIY